VRTRPTYRRRALVVEVEAINPHLSMAGCSYRVVDPVQGVRFLTVEGFDREYEAAPEPALADGEVK
jgi:hypothetical protein